MRTTLHFEDASSQRELLLNFTTLYTVFCFGVDKNLPQPQKLQKTKLQAKKNPQKNHKNKNSTTNGNKNNDCSNNNDAGHGIGWRFFATQMRVLL